MNLVFSWFQICCCSLVPLKRRKYFLSGSTIVLSSAFLDHSTKHALFCLTCLFWLNLSSTGEIRERLSQRKGVFHDQHDEVQVSDLLTLYHLIYISKSSLFSKKVFVCFIRQDHPDLLENVNKKSNVPEKPKTPQQLWYSHEKKAFLKGRPDVSPTHTHSRICCWLLHTHECCKTLVLIPLQATTKDIKDSVAKQWPQLSDKKRMKWIMKSLEQHKLYEVKMLAFFTAYLPASSKLLCNVWSFPSLLRGQCVSLSSSTQSWTSRRRTS